MLIRLAGLAPATTLLGVEQPIGAAKALPQSLGADLDVHHALKRANIVPG